MLMVAGFCVPPTGIIDGSVLTATGELFGFATLFQLPELINGRAVNLKHGNTSLSLRELDAEDDNNNEINDSTTEEYESN